MITASRGTSVSEAGYLLQPHTYLPAKGHGASLTFDSQTDFSALIFLYKEALTEELSQAPQLVHHTVEKLQVFLSYRHMIQYITMLRGY